MLRPSRGFGTVLEHPRAPEVLFTGDFVGKKKKHDIELREARHTHWARDVGFLQGGNTVFGLEGCRWNIAGPARAPLFPPSPVGLVPPFGGGELQFSPNGQLALSISKGPSEVAEREAALRASFPSLSSVIFLPHHADYIPHLDMYACFVGDKVVAVHGQANPQFEILLDALLPFVRDKGVRLLPLPHDPPSGWRSRVPTAKNVYCGVLGGSDIFGLRWDAAGNYIQSLVTRNAVYVPQYGGVHLQADKVAMVNYRAAVEWEEGGRKVVGVPWKALGGGGGLHCLTTQLEGEAAGRLLGALRDRVGEMQPVMVFNSDGTFN